MDSPKADSHDISHKSRFVEKVKHRFHSLYSNEYTFFILVAIFIGLIAGVANFVFVSAYEFLYSQVVSLLWGTLFILVPLVTGGIILCALSYLFPKFTFLGYGFPQFLENVNLKGGIPNPKEAGFKTFGSLITLGFGGSAGQEGPIAQLGGLIGSVAGQILKASKNKGRVLIACGVSGSIAATFNAPIAGVLFAEEIALLRDFKVGSFVPIVISSAVATVVSQSIRGNEAVLKVPAFQFLSHKELFFYTILGVLIGIFAAAFIKIFFLMHDTFSKIRIPHKTKPILGGLIIGLMGVFFPFILGNGYEHIEEALFNHLPIWIILGLIILKPIATSITIGSGWPGGIFAPSIFIGAVMGTAFGKLVDNAISSPIDLSGAYGTVGMGAFLAAVTQAPLTSIFLIFEMTRTYEVVIPIMICSVIAWVVTRLLTGGSLESIDLKRRGIELEEELEDKILHHIRVEDVMTRKIEVIYEDMTLRALIEYIPRSHYTTFPVVDKKGFLTGIISIQDFREWLFEESLKDLIVVKEIATLNVITATPDDSLYAVLKKWGKRPSEILPVIESVSSKKVIGTVSRKELIAAYNKALTDSAFQQII